MPRLPNTLLLWILDAEKTHYDGAYVPASREILGIYNSDEDAYGAEERVSQSHYTNTRVYPFDQEEDNL
jgi:hypothetical protein